MKAFDMVSLIETCEKIKLSLEEGIKISILVIDTIANPISLLMNKGQLQGIPSTNPREQNPRYPSFPMFACILLFPFLISHSCNLYQITSHIRPISPSKICPRIPSYSPFQLSLLIQFKCNELMFLGHALMQSFIHLLRLLTQQYSLTTLLINTAVKSETIGKSLHDNNDQNVFRMIITVGQSAFMDTRIKPSLGITWTFCADTCLLMHRSLREERIIIEVLRSRNGECGWTWIPEGGF